MIPLVANAGAVFVPQARLFVLDEERRVIAGPLVVARRRAYQREWLLSFIGVRGRAAVEGWRDHYIATDEPDADV